MDHRSLGHRIGLSTSGSNWEIYKLYRIIWLISVEKRAKNACFSSPGAYVDKFFFYWYMLNMVSSTDFLKYFIEQSYFDENPRNKIVTLSHEFSCHTIGCAISLPTVCHQYGYFHSSTKTFTEPPHDKTNKMACAPSEDSDQPGHPPSLIPTERTAKTRIRLGGCPGWSKSSLGVQSFCWFCCEAAQMSWYFTGYF